MIPIVLVGARGRMGRAVEAAAARTEGVRIRARVGRPSEPALSGPAASRPGYGAGTEPGRREVPGVGASPGTPPDATPADGPEPTLESVLEPGDVVIEFSSPAGCAHAARLCRARGVPLVSGTTGLGPAEEAEVRAAAQKVAVLRAPNFSLGVLALRRAMSAALEIAPPGWDVEIVERHHRGKVDSPSGTALALAREAAASRGTDERSFRFGREGRVGPRLAGEIGIHAVRGGTWTGDHAVLIAGDGEWIELRHVAEDRVAFAAGAVAAAQFVATAPAGLYNLEHLARAGGRSGTP